VALSGRYFVQGSVCVCVCVCVCEERGRGASLRDIGEKHPERPRGACCWDFAVRRSQQTACGHTNRPNLYRAGDTG
jgi:hypothetical protein